MAIGLIAESIVETLIIHRTRVAQTIPSTPRKTQDTCTHHCYLHQQNTYDNRKSRNLLIGINPYQGPLLVRPHVFCGEHPKGFVEVCVHYNQLWLYP